MKTGMSLSMGRQMNLGPMLQRSLKMLQMNSLEFARELNSMLESNPLLEIEEVDGSIAPPSEQLASEDPGLSSESTSSEEYSNRVSLAEPWGQPGSGNRDVGGNDHADWIATIAEQSDLRDHLRMQITDSMLEPDLEVACLAVIESLDDRGYLTDCPESLWRELNAAGFETSRDVIDLAAETVRALEPAGVGALDLADCLGLQLARIATPCEQVELARRIIVNHLKLLGQGNVRLIARESKASPTEVREAIALIKSLDPTPGREFDTGRVDYVVPEIAVRKIGGHWQALPLKGILPRVRINETYAEILNQQHSVQSSAPLKEKLQEARWLMRNLEQRDQTILAVGKAIVARQYRYFDHGEIALTPMTLADVAGDIGMHESTVSRVVSSKYLISPFGLKPMKMFFTSHIHTNAGDACSAAAVKVMIQRLIDNEVPDQPLSDHKLAELLSRRGLKIARRTVSKYRQALGIRSFELRRETVDLADVG